MQCLLKFVLANMIAILIMSAKLATPGLLKIKVVLNNGNNDMIFIDEVTKKLSRDSNYIIDLVLWP